MISTPSKTVFITGGGSGIGLAIAKAFHASGHAVTIGGRNLERLKAAGLAYVQMDVTDESSVRDAIEASAPIDIFVANAGAAETTPALQTDRALWDRMIAVNLTSVYLCAKYAAPGMVERKWGRFIAIASTASLKAYAYTGAYAAAKHGVIGWVKSLALELANTGVTANALCPGFTDTPLVDRAIDLAASRSNRSPAALKKTFTRYNPMNRLIKPEEVAAAALWLASDGAAAVNGQAIALDGGETAI